MSVKAFAKAILPPILWSALKAAGSQQSKYVDDNSSDVIAQGYATALETRYPILKNFGFRPTPYTASAIIDFYAEVLPLFCDEARGTHIRNALHRLMHGCADHSVQAVAAREIAATELLSNSCPDRATALANDPILSEKFKDELSKMEAAYGAPIVSEVWPGLDRGETLIYFFEFHPHLLEGKAVLHFAPEPNLREWIKERSGVASYRASNAHRGDSDETQDITSITHPESSFDVVLCHRVMEHVLDDTKAFSELYRILKPGGFVSFSVPQAPQRAETSEWSIPDLTHHCHVRHYGGDLETRMKAAGFGVTLERWLLEQPREALLARKAYPMRIFHLYKPR